MEQKIIIVKHLQRELAIALSECGHDRIFVLADRHTAAACWKLLSGFLCLKNAKLITVDAGDVHKDICSVARVWTELSENGASRHSCLINLGGGMITDLGGFAASTFKRGIDFINIPTTLLAMVDAAVGGKSGINLNGLKNEVGVFNSGRFVLLDTSFLKSLDEDNLLSGYAEMLKHGLLSNEQTWSNLLNFDLQNPDFRQLQQMVAESVKIKERIVKADPTEQGIRKSLNLGHTFGHAFESFAMTSGSPMLHGHAVALGLICELHMSSVKVGFPVEKMRQTVAFIRENYFPLSITCDAYPHLIELMKHDKKNMSSIINFTLISDVGKVMVNQTATEEEIKEALDFYREG